ncbi:MAG TPA: transferrin receptor-like dimerization domain-containing protein, partial [Fimbriimonadaceae bacterium]|nr:transferrin receptor-like dimerization domain-containing protein [Fimbriimonadaceae bacterium]
QLTFDPTKTLVPPKPKAEVPHLNLAPLQNAADHFAKAAAAFEEKRSLSPDLDETLMQAERVLLGPGLPGHPWYRHTLYAPGLYTGYGVKTLPGVREAIEQRNWRQAEEQAVVAAEALDRLSKLLEQATKKK